MASEAHGPPHVVLLLLLLLLLLQHLLKLHLLFLLMLLLLPRLLLLCLLHRLHGHLHVKTDSRTKRCANVCSGVAGCWTAGCRASGYWRYGARKCSACSGRRRGAYVGADQHNLCGIWGRLNSTRSVHSWFRYVAELVVPLAP